VRHAPMVSPKARVLRSETTERSCSHVSHQVTQRSCCVTPAGITAERTTAVATDAPLRRGRRQMDSNIRAFSCRRTSARSRNRRSTTRPALLPISAQSSVSSTLTPSGRDEVGLFRTGRGLSHAFERRTCLSLSTKQRNADSKRSSIPERAADRTGTQIAFAWRR
jgi:hypothetical protein